MMALGSLERDIMHCDISYHNIFLLPGWCLKLGDVGSAVVNGDTSMTNIVEEIR